MKLRQRLAAVLAATMVVTAVPVVTLASTNSVINQETGKKDRVYTNKSTGPVLKIKLDDPLIIKENTRLFYLEAEGFEFDVDSYEGTNEIFTSLPDLFNGTGGFGDLIVEIDKKTLKVDLSSYGSVIPSGTELFIPLYGKVTDETAKITINAESGVIKNETLIVAFSKDDKCSIKADDIKSVFDEGEIADIVFTEPYAGIVSSKADDIVYKGGNAGFEIKLKLNNSDFEFYNSKIEIQTGKGFLSAVSSAAKAEVVSKYGDEMTIWVPASLFIKGWTDADGDGLIDRDEIGSVQWVNSAGEFRIKGIHVAANTRTPKEGDLTLDVEGKLGEAKGLKVATIVNSDTKLYMKDEKTIEITAGKSEDATFFLEENVKDGILPGHTVVFELSEGAYFGRYGGTTAIKSATRADKVASAKKVITTPTGVEIVDVIMDDDKFVGFKAKFDSSVTLLTEKDKFEFKAPICVDLGTEDGKEIKLTAYGERAIDEEVSCTAAKVVAPIKVEADSMVVKVGLQKQKYEGKIVITETAAGKIGRGDIIISTPAEGYKFTGKGEVKVTAGDLVINKWENKNGYLEIEVKYASKTASTIEITGFEVDFNRTVPEGTFPIEVGGNALSSDHAKDGFHTHGTIEVKDFFRVNTKNTEDIDKSGLKAVVATFTAGSKQYTVDGEAKEMDAEAFIQDSRMMVPARYVAEAFGITGDNILFADGIVTIISGDKIVQLKAGSDIMTINGSSIKMDTKVVIKDGRTYLPVKFIGAALGVQASFDSATKTATFDNTGISK